MQDDYKRLVCAFDKSVVPNKREMTLTIFYN
jgi:hypothetical protein